MSRIQFAPKPSKLDQQKALFNPPATLKQVVSVAEGKLPAMIREAARKLASATTAAEVLEAKTDAGIAYEAAKLTKRIAEAKQASDKVVAAALRAQSDALAIESEAKARLADEYDAAQQRGEIGKRGQRTDKVPVEKQVPTAEEAGLSRKEIMDARQVRDAIAANPAVVRDALDQIIKDGDEPTRAALKKALAPTVRAIRAETQAAKKERRAEREITLAGKIKALPTEKFGVVLADPEWRWEAYSDDTGMDRAAANHYPTSPTEIIAGRDVASIAADDCVLFLWATVPRLLDALLVLAAWGFTYKSQFVWVKDVVGTGYWNRNRHEILLIGTKGDIPAPAMGDQWESVIEAPVGEHSAKPECVLEMVEAYYPTVPKIELNRRGPARQGWSAWGNEVEEAS